MRMYTWNMPIPVVQPEPASQQTAQSKLGLRTPPEGHGVHVGREAPQRCEHTTEEEDTRAVRARERRNKK